MIELLTSTIELARCGSSASLIDSYSNSPVVLNEKNQQARSISKLAERITVEKII